MAGVTGAVQYAQAQQAESLGQLEDLLRIPSVSTLPENQPDIARAAEWVADCLKRLDFERVEILPTARHPMVCGEWLGAGPDKPTVLVYGHYDVQPSDPDDLWNSPAFEPTIRGDNLFARGASDMKGQLVAFLRATEALKANEGLPVNLRFLIEGEEEVGSPNMLPFVQQERNRLQADICLNLDAGILAPDVPAITYTLRGLAYFEIRLEAAKGDQHSGTFGGAIDNPAQVLAHLIAGMKDRDGKILLPSFYDKVRPLTPEDRADLAQLPQNEAWWKEQAGVAHLFGEPEYTPTERATARPTLEVNGLLSGFTGEGSKTVLPARAMAKISCRLVPDQDPAEITESMRQYLIDNAPNTVTWELLTHANAPPGIVERESPAISAAQAAFEAVWGRSAVFSRQGGTVPVVGYVKQELGMDSLLLGFGLPDDNLHAPNEKLHLPSFYRGIQVYIHFLDEYGRAGAG
jgi:acetylornithine deacetylase/succinyl-diaminopimelate desuccinylase-like protein